MTNIVKHLAPISLAASVFLSLPIAAAAEENSITVASGAFTHESAIPLRFSAYGDNISPDLSWSNVPTGTQELALILDDPIVDMPQPFVHWVAYNIPATASGLPVALPTDPMVSVSGLQGMINGLNGTSRSGYFGPRPPVDGKVHEYNFRIYALDKKLNLPEGVNKEGLLKAMEGHILATGTLVGHYQQTE